MAAVGKQQQAQIDEDKKRFMPEGLFWEWRFHVESLTHKKSMHRVEALTNQNKGLQARILEQDRALHIAAVKDAEDAVKLADEEYKKVTKKVEQEMGIDFKDCTVNPITREIAKLTK